MKGRTEKAYKAKQYQPMLLPPEVQQKLDFVKVLEDIPDTISMEEMSKILYPHTEIGKNTIYFLLREHKILQKNNLPYQKYLDNGWFVLSQKTYTGQDQEQHIRYTTRVTVKGERMILALISIVK